MQLNYHKTVSTTKTVSTKALRYIYTKIIQKLPYEIKSKPKWEQAFRTNIEYTDFSI